MSIPSKTSEAPKRAPSLLYFVTEDWYFCSHRLPLAVAAKNRGFDVAVVTRVNQHGALIKKAGIRLIPLSISRGSKNPLGEWRTLTALFFLLRSERPDILHNVALKPVLYGALIARLANIPGVVNALAGLGHIFAVKNRAGFIRRLVILAFRLLLKGKGRIIVQNPDDLRLLENARATAPGQTVLIRGSGVDLERFLPSCEPPGPPIVLLAARLLWDKGVGDFVEAAKQLKLRGINARFVLVGSPDFENHAAIPEAQLHTWLEEGLIEWWGQRPDMEKVLEASTLFCLPSYYGEGVPKVLLEAAASGRPIITTDMPGCREVVRDGVNGLLVPPKDPVALAGAIEALLKNKTLRAAMSQSSRETAVREFGVEDVIEKTLDLYQKMLPPQRLSSLNIPNPPPSAS